jgi:hypothetical protein
MIPIRVACLLAAASIGSAAPVQIPTAPLVSIHVAVEDEHGRPVTNVRPEEFTLLLDNTPVTIEHVTTGPTPLHLIVIVDVTVFPQVEARSLYEAVDRVGASLRAEDVGRIWRLGGRITRGPAFTADARSRRTAASFAINEANVERSGPSPIWDAIVEAIDALEHEDGRRAILLYTDGRATANRHGSAEAATRAIAADVSVNVVMPASEYSFRTNDQVVTVHPDRMPQAVARDTGGKFAYFPSRHPAPDGRRLPTFGETLAAVVTSLQHEYVLRAARPEGEPRLLSVRLSRPGLTLRARRAL